jgi:Sel1 repeat
MVRISDLDVVFISYDEPRREEFWLDLKKKAPTSRRVQDVKGLDSCHKAAAQLAHTDHVVTVDADCIVDPAFFEVVIDDDLLRPNTRVDWPSRNIVNGVVSGNGGIKCWPKAMILSMRSHEHANPEEMSIDFPRTSNLNAGDGPYRFEHTIPMATVYCNGSPLQAFRCAFREAIRLGVAGQAAVRGGSPAHRLHPNQRHRLLLWCSVGADIENGIWCIYGARLASQMLHLSNWNYLVINDFDWFENFWREEIAPRFAGDDVECRYTGYAWDQDRLVHEIRTLGASLRQELGLEVADLTADQSRFLKQIYEPVNLNVLDRMGKMFQRGLGVGQNEDKAVRCYEMAARVGHPAALYNLARFELAAGIGQRAIALLREASVLGNVYAAHRLGHMHRRGDGVTRDPARALDLFSLAAERGFAPACRAIAEMYERGDGVEQDLGRARHYYQLIGSGEPDLEGKLADLELRIASDRIGQ